MSILLGIDTGGTYTDAVVYDSQLPCPGGVLASAKALTRRHDLSLGIRESMQQVLREHGAERIELVSLSTTLATNSIVEGLGGSICLILIGYPDDALQQSGLGEVMGQDPVVFVEGGHDAAGEQVKALDRAKARKAVDAFSAKVSAFAVSGYFSVRNPSHENQVRALIRERSGLPVTCGHELTSNLHASRRALTAALNARLVSVLAELIQAVQGMLIEQQVRAPLMVVKGDGSLVDAEFALEYPIETILSGPAASVVGALHLSGKTEACVVDMGGTTTDIALVQAGKPVLNRDGAIVGGWQTMVQAVQIHTYGLGGDSEVHMDEDGTIDLGPRRLVPLSLLARDNAEVLDDLKRQGKRHLPDFQFGRYAIAQRSWNHHRRELGEIPEWLLGQLESGRAVAMASLLQRTDSPYLLEIQLGRLIKLGYIVLSGFTPTDAAHVLGLHKSWSREAAVLGAELMLKSRRGPGMRIDTVEQFCSAVIDRVILQSGRAVTAAVLAEKYGFHLESFPAVRRLFVDRALRGAESTEGASSGDNPGGREEGLLEVGLKLKRPLVAIGAPVSTYFPAIAGSLHTEVDIPAHAEVANAVGAVVGSIMQSVRVLITPLEGVVQPGETSTERQPEEPGADEAGGGLYRVHCEDGIHDFPDLESAAAYAERAASRRAEQLARRAGAAAVAVNTVRQDQSAMAAGDELFIQSLITATATGRPHLAGQTRSAAPGPQSSR